MNNRGLVKVISAYALWGTLTLYWRQFSHVPPLVMLFHRAFWSLIFLGGLLWYRGRVVSAFRELFAKGYVGRYLISSALITINWLTYMMAMSSGRIIECGLAYFVAPLITVAVSRVVFKERLNRLKCIGVGIAAIGVACKLSLAASFPWVAVVLSTSWVGYCVVRKLGSLGSIETLVIEVLMAAPIIYAVGRWGYSVAPFADYGAYNNLLLLLAGPLTAIPLLLVVQGLPEVSLQSLAVVQYLNPSLSVFIGWLLGETIGSVDFVAFPLIWLGVVVFVWRELTGLIFRQCT